MSKILLIFNSISVYVYLKKKDIQKQIKLCIKIILIETIVKFLAKRGGIDENLNCNNLKISFRLFNFHRENLSENNNLR